MWGMLKSHKDNMKQVRSEDLTNLSLITRPSLETGTRVIDINQKVDRIMSRIDYQTNAIGRLQVQTHDLYIEETERLKEIERRV